MEKQKEELFMMSKSRKPTLAEWTMQNGIILNQKSKPKTTTTVGAIHESPAFAYNTAESANPKFPCQNRR